MKRLIGILVFVGVMGCGDDDAVVDAGRVDAGPCATDLQCDDGLFCNGPELCVSNECVSGNAPCSAGQMCSEAVSMCTGDCDTSDADGDGFDSIACGGEDCDDTDTDRYPGNTEVCDAEGHDEDCDPTTYGGRDVDLDGFVDSACCNGENCGMDCADRLADVFPGAAEVCNVRDDDCDGLFDEGVSVPLHPDLDGDLHGTPEALQSCAGFAGTSATTIDCDDENRNRHGAHLEICDGIDNDCDEDTSIDEGTVEQTWYPDGDGDGFGVPQAPLVQCGQPEGYSLFPTDCQDEDDSVHPAAAELCNGLDDNCDGFAGYIVGPGDTEDDDGDGFADNACGGNDCDDLDPYAYVGAPELMDGVDNDCDGTTDEDVVEIEWYLDADRDGLGDGGSILSNMRQDGRVPGVGDCDDMDPARRGAEPEICDGIDNDCDGTTDEEAIGMRAYYADTDSDNFGDPDESVFACTPPENFVVTPGDCDDTSMLFHPGADELCDMLDNDCDGITDEDAAELSWFRDFDGDGYGTGPVLTRSCAPVAGQAPRDGDCADGNFDVNPDATEACNGLDDDCDMATDEGLLTTFYQDSDEDGAGDMAVTQDACIVPDGYVATMDDCDDMDSDNFPGNDEVCDMADNDCDMLNDEDLPTMLYYEDVDGDGYAADGAASILRCAPPMGYSSLTGDCDEMSTAINPAAMDICNGVNDDCDMATDEGAGFCAISGDYSGECVPAPAPINQCACVAAGAGECDGDPSNGCEIDLTRDARHCGQCGNACSTAQRCNAGTCEDTPIVGLSSGGQATCARREGGVLQCWGQRTSLLGGSPVPTATALLSEYEIIDLSDSSNNSLSGHSCFITPGDSGNDVYCWGNDQNGQCGDGSLANGPTIPAPQRVLASVDDVIHDWVQVELSSTFSYARRASGEIYSWGGTSGGDSGQLGRLFSGGGDGVPRPVPVIDDAIDMDAAHFVACAVRSGTNQAWCWGGNPDGDGADVGGAGPTPQPVVDAMGGAGVPIPDVAQVELHHYGGCVRQSTGGVHCWGASVSGALGNGTSSGTSYHAVPVTGITDATDISCGNYACCAVTGGGIVQCWGRNDRGQIGNNSTTNQSTPVSVRLADDTALFGVRDISMSYSTTCALLATDDVACWGWGQYGQLGDDSIANHMRDDAGAPDLVIGL